MKVNSIDDLPPKYREQARLQLMEKHEAKPMPAPVQQNISRKNASSRDMNKTEREYYNILKAYGFKDIHCQAINLHVGEGKSWYRPDFYVGDINTFIEVKGAFVMDDGLVKLKAAAMMYPTFRWIKAQKIKGQWTETVIHEPTK